VFDVEPLSPRPSPRPNSSSFTIQKNSAIATTTSTTNVDKHNSSNLPTNTINTIKILNNVGSSITTVLTNLTSTLPIQNHHSNINNNINNKIIILLIIIIIIIRTTVK
jgi:hypothetical protein